MIQQNGHTGVTSVTSAVHDGSRVAIARQFNPERVDVFVEVDGAGTVVPVDRREFLAAVASLDAIVIPREDLPRIVAVSQDGLDFTVDFGEGRTVTFSDETPESIDETALGWLAIREHFREHQPLNIVSFLAGEIAAARGESAGTSDFQAAWRLVRSGRIEVKAEGGDAS